MFLTNLIKCYELINNDLEYEEIVIEQGGMYLKNIEDERSPIHYSFVPFKQLASPIKVIKTQKNHVNFNIKNTPYVLSALGITIVRTPGPNATSNILIDRINEHKYKLKINGLCLYRSLLPIAGGQHMGLKICSDDPSEFFELPSTELPTQYKI
ncbi:hypothetical protein HERIO_1945 [Hepatospora eriocheir]|uniref:Uncharacterized protein n=1 Tax=Hepatospora eriocheir TaxID=1081669 RepID=A0A1X0Q8P6_9MICR|nr:hypothetical protein HERIO_1945 [Hepatospora eriocheir]